MKKLVLWILAILGIIFLLLIGTVIAGVYFLKDIDKVKVDKFEVTGIKSLSKESVKVNGNIYLNNPSRLSIPIKEINFKIYLNETGREISSGKIPTIKVESKKINKIPFQYDIKFGQMISIIPKLLLKDKVPATVKINVTIDYPIIRNNPIPFEFEIDIKEYLQNYVREQTGLNGLPSDIPSIEEIENLA